MTIHETSTPMNAPGGLPASLHYPQVPVGELLRGAAARYGERAAFVVEDVATSYNQMWDSAARFANHLAGRGIGPGDVVAIHLGNGPAFVTAYAGTMLAGATFSPVNPLLPDEPLIAQLDDCGARIVVTSARADVFSTAARAIDVIVTDRNGSALSGMLSDAAAVPPAIDVDPNALAHIAYTGGTTGQSKGVELTHRNVVTNVLQFTAWLHGAVASREPQGVAVHQIGSPSEWPTRLGTGIVINLTPWFHAMGTIGSMLVPLVAGVTSVLHERFDPAAYLRDAERLRVTSFSGAPAIYAALLAVPDQEQFELSSVTYLSSGASPISHDLAERLTRRFPDAVIAEGYGLTEATMGATYGPIARSGVRKIGSVGVPVFDTAVEIRDADSGRALPAGEPGEVLIRGPQVMRGYHERPRDTAAVLEDGWLRTGDIGVLDDDGYLSIVDRSKDMLIYKGYNVYPRELEELLVALPQIRAASVVGRSVDDLGELPVAFVVADGDDPVDTDAVMAQVNAQVLPYKRIREVYVVDTLPVSAAGKILKRELRSRLEGAQQ